jgi:hypothetical protein
MRRRLVAVTGRLADTEIVKMTRNIRRLAPMFYWIAAKYTGIVRQP